MWRRDFLQNIGAVAALPLANDWVRSKEPGTGARLPNEEECPLASGFVASNDRAITQGFANQLPDDGSPFAGGFPNPHGICFVSTAAWQICRMVAGWVMPNSAHHNSKELQHRLNLAIDFLTRMQHEDGTIDLISTNFHSPPDTGFLVEPLALALSIVRRHQIDSLQNFQERTEDVLQRAGRALEVGGVHTPNHRWVVCMALARIYSLMPDDRFLRRIDQWLAEGIDSDRDGQYFERSTSGYSPLVNRCLITVARLVDRPELYEPVRRNLNLTRFLVRPNGELVTEISRRQDQYQPRRAAKYYYPYCYLARLDDNGDFAAMAKFIEKSVGITGLLEDYLYCLEDPHALGPLPTANPLPTNYERALKDTRVVRLRRGKLDATILADNSSFFVLHKGAAVLQSLRLASAFFGKGQFVAEDLQQIPGGYRLKQQLIGPYFQPLPSELLPGDGDWAKMPKQQREQSEVQKLETTVEIREEAGKFNFEIRSIGTERVPWAVEFGLRPGGALSGVRPVAEIPASFIADSQEFSYQVGAEKLTFTSAKSNHEWTQLRGALPKLDLTSVYITGYTPIDLRLTIS